VNPRFQINKRSEGIQVITLLDTAAASTNLGDQIIMDAVRRELSVLFPHCYVYSVATHERMGRHSRHLLRRSEFAIAGGTSLISSHMWFRPDWKLHPRDSCAKYKITLMGVGWYQYQREPDLYTRWLLRGVLSKQHMHSVRDSYTKNMLASIGVTNVVNTGCPTLWRLTPERCAQIPRKKAKNVIVTLNTFMPRPDLDRQLLKTLRSHYRKVYFWVPTETDYAYAAKLDPELIYLKPSLEGLDDLLESDESLDYVGNRLHPGIRAMQKGRRTIILEIDNRAREMGADFGLPTIERDAFEDLSMLIENPLETRVRVPRDAIDQWKKQFLTPGTSQRSRQLIEQDANDH
jgi:polysaccharide pyruvyl transferase WcaK-like protein